MTSFLTHLECSACGDTFDSDRIQTVCASCGKVLFPRYDLAAAGRELTREALIGRPANLWRYAEVLPIRDAANVGSLGEGWTPLLTASQLGQTLGCRRLLLKDEGLNPTGSFKARGMAVAVSRARELGATVLATPSAGNAGSALAAYAARAGLSAHVFMPMDAPTVNQALCVALGARLYLVRGLIGDCGRIVRRESPGRGWFDLSTLREPYRVEGKKTMGFELVEQLGWRLPDVIVYPTGGGTGIVGMWKAFEEMETLGWIGSRRPRMISVQATGCAPIVRAFETKHEHAEPWTNATTIASGLRVPSAIGDYLILDAIRQSNGVAVAVDDSAIRTEVLSLARTEGLFVSFEAAATVAGLRQLVASGTIDRDEEIVLFMTGSGLLNVHAISVNPPIIDPDDVEGFARVAETGT